MLMYGYWQHKFGGDRAIAGQTIKVDGKQTQVIGVMPKEFHFLDQDDPALLIPFQFDRAKTFLGNFSFMTVARLKPGVTIERASMDVARMLPIVMSSFPAPPGFSMKLFQDARIRPRITPLKDRVVGDVGKMLWVLMAAIGMVLLIACANVANLVLVRVEGRRQELSIRAALGAGWSRIAGELLFESVVLGLLGSLLGLGLAYGALRMLVAMAPHGLPRVNEIGIDGTVLLFTLGLAILASLLFGSIPIFKYAGARLSAGLREGARGMSQSREQHRARNVLVVVQVGSGFAAADLLRANDPHFYCAHKSAARLQHAGRNPDFLDYSIPRPRWQTTRTCRASLKRFCASWRPCRASRRWRYQAAFRWTEMGASIRFLLKTILTGRESWRRCADSSGFHPAFLRPWARRW